MNVLIAGGYRVHVATPIDGASRPLCCGRTFLSIGKVDEARQEAERTLAALAPYLARGVPVVGLEPSCILSFRDEIPALLKSDRQRLADTAFMFEEFLVARSKAEDETCRSSRRQTRDAARPLPPEIVRGHG